MEIEIDVKGAIYESGEHGFCSFKLASFSISEMGNFILSLLKLKH